MVLDAYVRILALLALGLALRRLGWAGERSADWLNRAVLWLCLPAAVLLYAPQLQLDRQVLAVAVLPWLLLPVVIAAVAVATRALALRRDQQAVLLLTVALGNTSFLGYPMVRALLGDAALPHAVVYDQLGAFLMLSTFGLWVLARFGGDAPPSALTMAGRILRFPPFLALVVGFTVMPASPPAPVALALQWLADAMLPLVMVAIGLSLRLALPRGERAALAMGLGLKLLAVPLLAWALSWLLGLQGLAQDAAVLESAMPPMLTAAALAIGHRLAPALAAAMAGYGILLALITLPLWAWALGH